MKKSNSTEVLEVEEIPLEEVIELTLAKHNVTENVILALKENYGNVRLKSIDDKESFLEVKEARKNVRAVGILVEKLCKKGREDAVAIQKKWLKKESEILGKIAEVQDPLDADIKKFDDEIERKELEEAKQREAVYMNRQATLSKLGAIYDNGSFVLNHISYEVELIKQSDDDMWNDTILPKYKKVYDTIEAERVAEEEKRRIENERLQKEKEEFEEKQRVFRQQQEEFAKQQAEMQRQKDEAERKEREQKLQEQKLIDAANEKKWRDRLAYLNAIKWNGHEACSGVDGSVVFTYDELIALPDDTFFERAKDYINSVALFNKAQEEKLQAKIAEDIKDAKELAVKQERERIEIEQRKKIEEIEQSNDKARFHDIINQYNNIVFHEMKSTIYKKKLAFVKEKHLEILSV